MVVAAVVLKQPRLDLGQLRLLLRHGRLRLVLDEQGPTLGRRRRHDDGATVRRIRGTRRALGPAGRARTCAAAAAALPAGAPPVQHPRDVVCGQDVRPPRRRRGRALRGARRA
uniref:Uncharacterized protein n=1 Tax=Arundo donax TaxID=35708 RepID=A0A0A9A807_ARUDO